MIEQQLYICGGKKRVFFRRDASEFGVGGNANE